ncbi:hypothetical protein D1AOALGA4SA_7364 [Olavius algarvensis Delta 1 endosymbiont]|nr:hypothetical protein D1AOALGA4SA_7364 [Olavius algarvensis Delta 1 endosymbiont]
MNKVENLKKITIAFRTDDSLDSIDGTPDPVVYTFIFALAPEGMTPFEYELAERREGDNIQLHPGKNSLREFFGHLNPPIGNLCQGRRELNLNVKILAIATAENREIVKAMAEMAAHGGGGCGCGCDCGCG